MELVAKQVYLGATPDAACLLSKPGSLSLRTVGHGVPIPTWFGNRDGAEDGTP